MELFPKRASGSYVALLIIVSVTVVIVSALYFAGKTNPQPPLSTAPTDGCPAEQELVIGDRHFHVMLAQTFTEQEQGLSGKAALREDEGMLFLFDDTKVKKFWMKDMLFPIDIIWISPDWTINWWADNAMPESYPKIFASPEDQKTQYVLELPSGTAMRQHFTQGEHVAFTPCTK